MNTCTQACCCVFCGDARRRAGGRALALRTLSFSAQEQHLAAELHCHGYLRNLGFRVEVGFTC